MVRIGPITLFSFGMMVAVAFLVGTWMMVRQARRYGIPGGAILDGIFWILLASVAGARLLYVGLHWNAFHSQIQEIGAVWKGGMSFHGGLIAGVAAGWRFARVRRLPLASLLDAAAPALALGYAIGRVGCLLNGCCYGSPTDLPWGMRFPLETGGWTEPSHPAQIYASLANLALFSLLLALAPRLRVSGQLAVAYLMGYSVYRFLVEFIRKGATAHVLALELTEAQWASLTAILLAAGLWLILRGRAPQPTTITPPAAPLRSGSVR
ncbi:MAG: prolipoprotein diacylglyceryl transferase [Armatimonadetes bacterium]|nr:prolipoprotein diacylglyceryl transferase [Armatimonadota bacterium]